MAKTKKSDDADSEGIPPKIGIKNMSIFDKYRDFLEKHLEREDHNEKKVVTDVLTVKSKGIFDYVSIEWTINTDKLKAAHPDVPLAQWSLYGIRRFSDFTKLDAFPKAVDGEIFLKTSHVNGIHDEYLKVDMPTNFAFFLVGEYTSLLQSNKKKVIGPLTLSFTPLRASTKEMCEEIRGLGNTSLSSAPNKEQNFVTKKALLAECLAEQKQIRSRTDLTEEEKEKHIERLDALYDLFKKDE